MKNILKVVRNLLTRKNAKNCEKCIIHFTFIAFYMHTYVHIFVHTYACLYKCTYKSVDKIHLINFSLWMSLIGATTC